MADLGTELGRGQTPGHGRQTPQQAAGAGVWLREDPLRRAEKAGLGTGGKRTTSRAAPTVTRADEGERRVSKTGLCTGDQERFGPLKELQVSETAFPKRSATSFSH